MSVATNAEFKLKGIHVLFMMLGFFAAIIGVDVAFSVIAIRTFPGEDEKHSYVQGLHYNQALERHAAERALGWRAAAAFETDTSVAAVVVTLRDIAGAPIDADVQGILRRPVDARGDRNLQFVSLGEGRYRAETSDLPAGAWDLRAEAVRANQHFSIERRLTWRPSTQP